MKSEPRGYEIVIGALLATAVVAVSQLFYGSGHGTEEIFGVKRGEWLLFIATLGLWFATWRLVKGAELTAERQLRAYVHITSQTFAKKGTSGNEVTITILLKNSGQTPAYKVSLRTGLNLLPFPTAVSSIPEPIEHTKSLTMGPGLENSVTVAVDLSEDELAALSSGDKAAYVHGTLRYVDAFGVQRYTQFTSVWRGAPPSKESKLSIVDEGSNAD